jgi:hypothetical protein
LKALRYIYFLHIISQYHFSLSRRFPFFLQINLPKEPKKKGASRRRNKPEPGLAGKASAAAALMGAVTAISSTETSRPSRSRRSFACANIKGGKHPFHRLTALNAFYLILFSNTG